ncbi:MAG TPA: hypothetical protein VH740_22805 [Vicinamibacterales bacterium]|jgi:hypothetical protein
MTTLTAAREAAFPAMATDRFYARMAVACLAVGVIGFAPTYWVPLVRGRLNVAPLAHLHALFFYGWLVLFVRQSSLAASGELVRHRATGLFGIALASGMFFVGFGMAIHSLKESIADGFEPAARAFTIVPVSGIILFAILFAVAIARVRDTDVHKRLMLVNTAGLLQAAAGRWFVLFLAPPTAPGVPVSPPPLFVTVMPGLAVDLLIVAGMIYDWRTRGRVHRVYWIAGGATLAVQLLRVPLSQTSAWLMVTHWLLAVAP